MDLDEGRWGSLVLTGGEVLDDDDLELGFSRTVGAGGGPERLGRGGAASHDEMR